jgi:quercetin dioxygenase-like cupin family protein
MSARFYKRKDGEGYRDLVEGIRFKTLVYGERTLLAEFRIKEGAVLPEHSHPHEQTGYLVSGRVVFRVEGRRIEVGPGDSWNIPGNLPHSAEVLEDAVIIEVFSPVREEYLD